MVLVCGAETDLGSGSGVAREEGSGTADEGAVAALRDKLGRLVVAT